MQLNSLDSAIQNELRLIEAIKQNSQRLSAPLSGVLVRTFVPPLLVFVLFALLAPALIPVIDRLLGGFIFPNTLYIVAVLLAVYAVIRVFRWSEARFGGLALMRRLGSVTVAVREVERAIDSARAQPQPAEADIAQINTLAQRAWTLYVETMQAYGYPVE